LTTTAPASPRWKAALFAAAYVVLMFGALEVIARVLVPAPGVRAPVQREHEELIEVLGLPALNEAMVPDPDLFWALRPGFAGVVSGTVREHPIRFRLTVDDRGFRGRPARAATDAFRILALGDSTTFGLGVDDDDAWPARLETLMNAAGKRVEVVNAGVPGYTAFQGLRFLRGRGIRVAPDLVVATFGFNDADGSWASRSDEETARLMALRDREAPLMRSRLYAGLKLLALWARPAAVPAAAPHRPRLSEEEFTEALAEMQDVATRAGSRLLLAIWPYASQAASGQSALVGYQSLVARVGETRGVPTADLVPRFVAGRRPLFIDHVHANAGGCNVAAEALANEIERLGLR
jgi:lysophospholipase L1-like esterase